MFNDASPVIKVGRWVFIAFFAFGLISFIAGMTGGFEVMAFMAVAFGLTYVKRVF